MSPLFKEIERHLEHYGYTTKFEDNVIKTAHTTKPIFWVHPASSGALFTSIFELGAGGKADPQAVLEFCNWVNWKTVVSRFICDKNSLQVVAWLPGHYDKAAFSEFFDLYMSDIETPISNDRELVRKLFWNVPSIPGLEP